MGDVIKIAKETGRFDDLGFDEISLRSELREHERRPYEPPSEVIRRVTAELGYLQDRERVLKVMGHIKGVYKK